MAGATEQSSGGNGVKSWRQTFLKNATLPDWMRGVAAIAVFVSIFIGFLAYRSGKDSEAAARLMDAIALLDKDMSDAVKAGAITTMGVYLDKDYEKFEDQAVEVLAIHLATEESPFVIKSSLDLMLRYIEEQKKEARTNCIKPLVRMNRRVRERYSISRESSPIRPLLLGKPLDPNLDAVGRALCETLTSSETPNSGGMLTDEIFDTTKSEVEGSNEAGKPEPRNLAGLCIVEWSFENAKLNHSNFERTVLIHSSLKKSKMEWVNLRDAHFYDVDLTGATLNNADLSWAYFVKVPLKGAHLNDAILEWATLVSCDLNGADLTNAKMRDAALQGADMREAILEGTDLEGTDLEGTDLRGAKFDPESIKKAKNWRNAIFDDEARQVLGLEKSDDEAYD